LQRKEKQNGARAAIGKSQCEAARLTWMRLHYALLPSHVNVGTRHREGDRAATYRSIYSEARRLRPFQSFKQVQTSVLVQLEVAPYPNGKKISRSARLCGNCHFDAKRRNLVFYVAENSRSLTAFEMTNKREHEFSHTLPLEMTGRANSPPERKRAVFPELTTPKRSNRLFCSFRQ
jgi:hypothetical protein